MAELMDMAQHVGVVEALGSIGAKVLEARQEEDFLVYLAETLRAQVGCDVVILRLLEQYIQTRVVATPTMVETLPPDRLVERFTHDDQQRWLSLADGVFCQDVGTAPHIKPQFRQHALQLGLKSGFMVPLIRDGEICGQIVFAWSSVPKLDSAARTHLRKLSDYACLMITLFYLKRAEERDVLTGLLNRSGLRRRWEKCAQAPQGVLLFADLDGFKSLNDARGHLAGDDFLRQVARILNTVCDSRGVIARYGGDEFVVVVPGLQIDEAKKLRSAIDREIRALGKSLPPPSPNVIIGLACWPEDSTELDVLIEQADRRMYEKKRWRATARLIHHEKQSSKCLVESFCGSWLDGSPDGVIVTDRNQRVIYINPAYRRMTGYSLEEWLGERPSLVASGKTPPRVYEEMWHHLELEGAWMGQVVNRHRSGEEWISYLSITRLLDQQGQVVGYMGVTRDVGEKAMQGEPPLTDDLQGAFTQEALAFALAEAAELHEGGSREHLRRIREFTRILTLSAAKRGYPELGNRRVKDAVIQASILHDIGKMAIPQSLLTKPGSLTPEEYEVMKTHTIAGYNLLQSPHLRREGLQAPCLFLSTAARIARHHHERWDGTGYPDNLVGEEIPLEARLVGIVDVYDALRSRRPYKEPWSHEAAVAYIHEAAGTQFDPNLVELFLSLEHEFAAAWDEATAQ